MRNSERFKQTCQLYIYICLQQVRISCWDDGILRKPSVYCPPSMSVLGKVFTDMFLIMRALVACATVEVIFTTNAGANTIL